MASFSNSDQHIISFYNINMFSFIQVIRRTKTIKATWSKCTIKLLDLTLKRMVSSRNETHGIQSKGEIKIYFGNEKRQTGHYRQRFPLSSKT